MRASRAFVLRAACAGWLSLCLAACGGAAGDQAGGSVPAEETVEATVEETQATAPTTLADGSYDIQATTDSSMFRAESCTLTVADGAYTATLTLPGEGFSRLYFGSAEDAAAAPDDDIYDYYLDDEDKYTFELPVEALDEELPIAAFGHRRDTWYDHVIVFHAPEGEASADA